MNQSIPKNRRRQQSGSVLVLVAVFMVALFAFAALSFDVAYVFEEQRKIHSWTDAAALAAVQVLTNATVANNAALRTAAIAEATNIAQFNGIKASELATGAGIEIGQWNPNTSTFSSDASKPYNAVRVPAKRRVSLNFAAVVGMSEMTPAVQSVAYVTKAGSAYGGIGGGLIPFAVHPKQATNAFYVPYTFDKHDIGSGNFGKLNFDGVHNDDQGFNYNMVTGCDCSIKIGDFYPDIPGNAGIENAFAERFAVNPYVVMAVFDNNGPGNSGHGETITGFVGVRILNVNGNGNWTITVQNEPILISGGVGGLPNAEFASTRLLVQ